MVKYSVSFKKKQRKVGMASMIQKAFQAEGAKVGIVLGMVPTQQVNEGQEEAGYSQRDTENWRTEGLVGMEALVPWDTGNLEECRTEE